VETKLLPCPFCKCPEIESYRPMQPAGSDVHLAMCTGCGARANVLVWNDATHTPGPATAKMVEHVAKQVDADEEWVFVSVPIINAFLAEHEPAQPE
jgi:hypothetical protein